MGLILEFLLLGAIAAGCVYAFILLNRRLPHGTAYKYAVAVALAAAFLLFWVNGAVGIIGSENNDANMMYFGVIAVGVAGAAIARFQPRGMAHAMFATAAAMVLVATLALSTGMGVDGPIWPRDIVFITAFFAALWVGSALLFKHAARQQIAEDTGAPAT